MGPDPNWLISMQYVNHRNAELADRTLRYRPGGSEQTSATTPRATACLVPLLRFGRVVIAITREPLLKEAKPSAEIVQSGI